MIGLLATGCNPATLGGAAPVDKFFTVVFLNHSSAFANVLFAASDSNGRKSQWLIALGSQTWDSLVLGCDVDSIAAIGAIVPDSSTDAPPQEIGFNGLTAIRQQDFDCGSVIAVDISDASSDAARPIRATLRLVHASSVPLPTSGELLLVDVLGPKGVAADLALGWKDADANSVQFETTVMLSGREGRFGFLLDCPIQRFRAGSLDDDQAPAALIHSTSQPVAAPPELSGDALPCPSIVRVRLRQVTSDDGFVLTLEDAARPSAQAQMYATVRGLLDQSGLRDRPSNHLSLLPSPNLP